MSTRRCDSATTRELLGMVRDAAVAAPSPAVVAAVGVLTEAENGQALEACLELQVFAPRDAAPFDRELYAAAISVGAALWHVETGTDATAALDAAQSHLAQGAGRAHGGAVMTARDRQILRAVLVGRAVLDCGCLRIDGCWCSDQIAARRLVDNRLVAPAIPDQSGEPVRAMLTDAGRAALGVAA